MFFVLKKERPEQSQTFDIREELYSLDICKNLTFPSLTYFLYQNLSLPE
jgi:hypothetical protein